jgi:hypothetical protein
VGHVFQRLHITATEKGPLGPDSTCWLTPLSEFRSKVSHFEFIKPSRISDHLNEGWERESLKRVTHNFSLILWKNARDLIVHVP